jgi:hypothetical protein
MRINALLNAYAPEAVKKFVAAQERSWIAATVLVRLVTAVATLILPVLVLRKKGRRVKLTGPGFDDGRLGSPRSRSPSGPIGTMSASAPRTFMNSMRSFETLRSGAAPQVHAAPTGNGY